MRPGVYLETTVVSYLTARPSRDVVLHAHQQLTLEWWQSQRFAFDLFISPVVRIEAGRGDPEVALRRLAVIEDIPVLMVTTEATELAAALVRQGPLPAKAELDALHIATAAVHGIDYLLTWNCRHIANARMRPQIESLCRAAGYEPPILCTPEELTDA
jgi:predicted nucleic acid-binding protein